MKTKKPEVAENTPDINAYIKKGKKADFLSDVKPMLATLVDGTFDEPGWMYEVKWDGYRALGYVNEGEAAIRSRNNKSFDDKFYPVFEALKKSGLNAVVDGEIVVLNEKGVPDFGGLQT